MLNSKKKIYQFNIISFCIVFAVFFRVYNINFDNFWFDEILSFWITDPEISFRESFERHKSIEQIPYLYHFILKIIFEIFNYESHLGRYLSFFFNILGIFFATILCKNIKNNNSYLLALFLFSTNIFLINYSQELRPYSMIFFLCALNLYLFFKLFTLPKDKEIKSYYFIAMLFSNILMIISHPFSLIIFISTSIFLFFDFFKNKRDLKMIHHIFTLSIVFSIIYLIFLFANLKTFPTWITQPDFKFYTNLYFSKFFGSRLMGLTHLILLISLIVISFKKFKNEIFTLNVLITIIFLSYFLPIIYGYLFKPIIFPRYIIFVIIPVILLLSILVYEIKNIYIRNFIISFLVLLNLGNHFFESTFQQLYNKKSHFKPNLEKMIDQLIQSDEKSFIIDISLENNKEQIAYQAINNYIFSFETIKNSKIKYIPKNDFFSSKKNKVWILCLPDIVPDRCKNINSNPYYKIIGKRNIPGIKLILVEKI